MHELSTMVSQEKFPLFNLRLYNRYLDNSLYEVVFNAKD